jgi:integrase/recombinase XerD
MSDNSQGLKLSEIIPEFCAFIQVEAGFRPESIIKYRDCLKQVVLILYDPVVIRIEQSDIRHLKAHFMSRNLSVSRQVSILVALKRVLQYCRDEMKLPVFDPGEVRMPKRPRRAVTFLTAQEVNRFTESIRVETYKGNPHLSGLRLRALVEVLLGTAMRIGEVLSLDRSTLDFKLREARIIGKGNKERKVFFTERSLFWLERYLETRNDDFPALFVTQGALGRMQRTDVWRFFKRQTTISGIGKHVTPHLLRHTAATQLLFNGCPVGHIKEILGHERLETTCRYYLGLDQRAAQAAHQTYLTYDTEPPAPNPNTASVVHTLSTQIR